jgi:hypothetical protein
VLAAEHRALDDVCGTEGRGDVGDGAGRHGRRGHRVSVQDAEIVTEASDATPVEPEAGQAGVEARLEGGHHGQRPAKEAAIPRRRPGFAWRHERAIQRLVRGARSRAQRVTQGTRPADLGRSHSRACRSAVNECRHRTPDAAF